MNKHEVGPDKLSDAAALARARLCELLNRYYTYDPTAEILTLIDPVGANSTDPRGKTYNLSRRHTHVGGWTGEQLKAVFKHPDGKPPTYNSMGDKYRRKAALEAEWEQGELRRVAIRAWLLEGKSYAEISRLLGLSKGRVGQIVQRMREMDAMPIPPEKRGTRAPKTSLFHGPNPSPKT